MSAPDLSELTNTELAAVLQEGPTSAAEDEAARRLLARDEAPTPLSSGERAAAERKPDCGAFNSSGDIRCDLAAGHTSDHEGVVTETWADAECWDRTSREPATAYTLPPEHAAMRRGAEPSAQAHVPDDVPYHIRREGRREPAPPAQGGTIRERVMEKDQASEKGLGAWDLVWALIDVLDAERAEKP